MTDYTNTFSETQGVSTIDVTDFSTQFNAIETASATKWDTGTGTYDFNSGTLTLTGCTLTLDDNQIVGAKVAQATDTTEGVLEIATQAEMETPASSTLAVVPARVQNHPGVAKAWANLNSGNLDAAADLTGVNASHGITSIAKTGVGDYAVVFATAFSSGNYCAMITATSSTTDAQGVYVCTLTDRTTTGCNIDIETSGAAQTDAALQVDIIFFGDQ